MKEYVRYSSKIPSPSVKRNPGGGARGPTTPTKTSNGSVTSTPTRNVTSHSLSPPDKREKDSVSPTGSTSSSSPRHPPNGYPQQYSMGYASNNTTAEETILRLKDQLNEALARDDSAKAALAKSDKVILDLRADQRQLKRQLETFRKERSSSGTSSSGSQLQQEQQIRSLQAHIQELTHKLQYSDVNTNADLSKDAKVGELQVQLDRAHAQILTADMVRKELEDTLEAEQYTWELRVQDQERQIASLQQECDTLAQDLDQCRIQWKDAEHGWNEELEELRVQLALAQTRLSRSANSNENDNTANNNRDHDSLMKKIHQLETERAELQSCLDEALKELEAVDAELQTEDGGSKLNDNKSTIESLQHLLRWIYQEGPIEKRLNTSQLSEQTNTKELVNQIQEALEEWQEVMVRQSQQNHSREVVDDIEQRTTVEELQNQIRAHEKELKSREESSAELRESLKEAVALLKPLQDAVAQAESEKNELQQQLKDLEQDRQSFQNEISQQTKNIEMLQEQVSSLETQLEEQKRISQARESLLQATTPSPHKNRTISSTPEQEDSLGKIKRAREELRRKRETEGNLQQLLKDAQSRFKNLQEQNDHAAAKNRELQGQIERLGEGDVQATKEAELAGTLAQREAELQAMQEKLERMQRSTDEPTETTQKIKALEEDLSRSRSELVQREQAERVLNKSLKEALGLLKPLQMHLEEAEQEKMEISKELRNLRKRFRQLQMGEGDDFSRSTIGGYPDVSVELIKIKDELEETVRQLELENSQLHDALEDLTEDGAKYNEARMRQQLVELNSRYEVTQNKLEDAHVENHALVKALKQKEMEEMKRNDEMRMMQEKLQRTESELHNAKAIAKSALVKVEELTMSNIEHLSREGPVDFKVDGAGHLSGVLF